MNPFYFGTSDRRIFGVLTPPSCPSHNEKAVVICYPWGPEYIHAHRAIRMLANMLSKAGFYSLRFDYFGTGDSAGEMVDADFASFEADLEVAIAEIRDITNIGRVTLVGLRLGAIIAARVAARLSHIVESLILWDPVLSGEAYLQSLTTEPLRDFSDTEKESYLELCGFRVAPRLVHDIRGADICGTAASLSTRTLLIASEALPCHLHLSTGSTNPGGNSMEIEVKVGVQCWIEDRTHGGRLPISVVQRIVNWLG